MLRLHSNLLWEKVREAGRDEPESKDSLRQRERLFSILRGVRLPEDELAPHAACVVDYLRTFGQARTLSPVFCLDALIMMSHMPAAVIEKHIDSVMFWVIAEPEEDGDFFVQPTALQVIAKLAPKTLASLNLKAQIAAAPLAESKLRSEREQVAKLLKSIPD